MDILEFPAAEMFYLIHANSLKDGMVKKERCISHFMDDPALVLVD